jgi:hypothetical protein
MFFSALGVARRDSRWMGRCRCRRSRSRTRELRVSSVWRVKGEFWPWRVKGEFCLQGYLQGYLCEKKNVFFLLVGLRGSAEEFRVDGLGIIRSSWIPRRALCVFCLQGYV